MEEYVDYLKAKGRFGAWIVVILILLVLIPLLISFHFSFIAKLFGLMLIIVSSLALFVWIRKLSESKVIKNRVPLNRNDIFWLNANIPFYRKLNATDKKVFENRISLFVAEIIMTDVEKEVPEKSDCLYVASAAIIAYWGLPYWNYGELKEVLIYPDNFDFENKISKNGFILGKVHHGGLMDGTMILSRTALIDGFRNITDGRNVGIHEFAHLIDKSDGHIDGLPLGLSASERKHWVRLFQSEINNPSFKLDNYARTNQAEFFAVTSEMFKENPDKLQKHHPELFNILQKFYSKS